VVPGPFTPPRPPSAFVIPKAARHAARATPPHKNHKVVAEFVSAALLSTPPAYTIDEFLQLQSEFRPLMKFNDTEQGGWQISMTDRLLSSNFP